MEKNIDDKLKTPSYFKHVKLNYDRKQIIKIVKKLKEDGSDINWKNIKDDYFFLNGLLSEVETLIYLYRIKKGEINEI